MEKVWILFRGDDVDSVWSSLEKATEAFHALGGDETEPLGYIGIVEFRLDKQATELPPARVQSPGRE